MNNSYTAHISPAADFMWLAFIALFWLYLSMVIHSVIGCTVHLT